MYSSFSFTNVPRTAFGAGCSIALAEIVESMGLSRPLIVTDQGIIECGLLEPILVGFSNKSISTTVFTDVQADPPERNILDACALASAGDCDSVIGFGGGSSMDVAKLVAALVNSEQQLSDMYGVEQITGGRLPLIQVPTTAGTGSEATAVAVITTGESSKAGVVSGVLFADHIVLDPELTLGLPANVTAATGIDAMVHALEAFTSKRLKNPLSDMLALRALSLLSRNIEAVVKDGHNLAARSEMLLGATLAGQAFANAPVAAVHALAYPLGGLYHIPHGLSNSLMLPHVIRFNAPMASDLYLQAAAAIHSLDSKSLNVENIGTDLADYFFTLARTLNLPTKLQDMQIKAEGLSELAEQALKQQRLLINNPRDVSYDDALAIYQQAF